VIKVKSAADRLTVSEITSLIKRSLEHSFSGVRIEGEISNYRPSSSGHLYFTLKDAGAMISAVMFRGRASRLDFAPEDGQLVIASGNISVYEKRGNYQIICERLEKAGVGDILAMLEERKRKLAAEGLFDETRKKPLPLFPSRVAVVTSPTGAAIKDILRVTRRRNAGVNIVILPAQVQGDAAAPVIERQIRAANRLKLGDVIVVTRGGGSLEDLLPFSDERVVRAVAESSIPIISAVGHEIDLSLSDLAADVRAATPSAAAEIVSANRVELVQHIHQIRSRMEGEIAQRLERIQMLLGHFSTENLERSFRVLIQPLLLRLDDAKEDLIRSMKDLTLSKRHRLELGERGLNSQSPLSILDRGYALVSTRDTNELITTAGTAKPGDEVNIRLKQGSLGARVTEVKP
jgi:exodeoxyribonuclease VII large subunit